MNALEIRDLHAWYGESHILHGIHLSVQRGQVLTLLGRNGAGRTTTLRAIMGLTGRRQGSIRVHGEETIALPTHRIAHLGLGYCPEERGIFASLTTEENLRLPPLLNSWRRATPSSPPGRPKGETPPLGGEARSARGALFSEAQIYEMFPNLAERKNSPGTRLSGGEQQMLAVARILRTGADILLLDEISEGLAPVIVQALARMITTLKAQGFTIVMVEQNFRFAAPLADHFIVVEHGEVVASFPASELAAQQAKLDELLSV
ncbi:ABC transporter ATP-binding protein [Paucibacter sp. DJ1R-11]|uniref:ABC transporter ATP-binding protein n=1 Tax=Paucibacter sp. DJ1R-11 TaxID=2893556 RepID=UPI0021E3F721|nr:ABC transporter ATP-binding protein [Paucibacter sp. DJ1R-11]MCV2362941.1 ABC transporter ATP-binding protein [Paucibacter sp. DJ1R-11]